MPNEIDTDSCLLGQFVPVQYHHNLLMDQARLAAFKAAIDYAVKPGARVLELGGGTGVLSWFAAEHAARVWCVELNRDMVKEAGKLLALNRHAQKIEVVHADAFTYLPPEPVDVVICDMLHTALLREKQLEVIESFKRRYLQRFGGPLPVFLPEAALLAIQPVQQIDEFEGYRAPIVQFQQGAAGANGLQELAAPVLYAVLDFSQANALTIQWEGSLVVERPGMFNALRLITKNVLAVVAERNGTVDWICPTMTVPLAAPLPVQAGDRLALRVHYSPGASIASLQAGIEVALQPACALPAPRTAPVMV